MKESASVRAICITADVINSRENGKEEKLESIVKTLNEKYSKKCLILFTKRFGDEIFGVLANYANSYGILKELFNLSTQQDLPLYVGIGIGTVKDINIIGEHDVNGTAIWNATDALKLLKDNDQSIKFFKNKQATFKYFFYANEPHVPHMLINYMSSFIFDKIERRTEKQAEVIESVESFPDLTLESIGEKVGYKQNAGLNISKVLIRSEYYFVKGAELELVSLLKQIEETR